MRRTAKPRITKLRNHAELFAALGDDTRLALVRRLANGQPASIVQLTEGSEMTRQAMTKHLRVLEKAGIVHNIRSGRESLFEFDPEAMEDIRQYLEHISLQWDQTLLRLKSFVEEK